MGRKRKYETNSERHAAYRKRKKENGRVISVYIPNKGVEKKDYKPGLPEIVRELEEKREHNEMVLRAEIKKRESQIAELERKNRKILEELASKIHDTLTNQTNHIHRLTQRLINETKATVALIKGEVTALKCEAEVKEHLLVIKDGLQKVKSALIKDIEGTDQLISDRLVAIESLVDSETKKKEKMKEERPTDGSCSDPFL